MRVLLVHNYYGHYATGGEGSVFEAESQLLEEYGHKVRKYTCTNSEVTNTGIFGKISAFWQAPWSQKGYRAIKKEIVEFRPDIIHVHNFWVVLSPSIFRAARELGVATVLTLHNYRLVCPGGLFSRGGKVCEKCLGRNPWRVIWHRCYRNSLWGSIARYRLYQRCKREEVWKKDVDAFIVLTAFARSKFLAGGLPPNRVYVKPNFVEIAFDGAQSIPLGHGAVFIGRLSNEKGLPTLLSAWRDIDYPLSIVGDGPLQKLLGYTSPKNVKFLGFANKEEVFDALKKSYMLIFPSECYEGLPLTLIEAMAFGRPAIASGMGGRLEIIDDGQTGLLFEPGNPDDLKRKVQMLIANNDLAAQMGRAARQKYLNKYTPEVNYQILMQVYQEALENSTASKQCKQLKQG